MERMVNLLVPTGMGIALVLVGSVLAIWNAGLQAAVQGPAALGEYIASLTKLLVLVVVSAAFLGVLGSYFTSGR